MSTKFAALVGACAAATMLGGVLAAPATARQIVRPGGRGHAFAGSPAGWAIRTARPQGAPSALAGYAWSTSALGNSIDAFYAFNSAGGAVTIRQPVPALYVVTFDGLTGVPKPTLDVTTYDAAAICQPVQSGNSPAGYAVVVGCAGLNGLAAGARFDLMVSRPVLAPHGVLDYALVRGRGTLASFQYNSSHRRNSVRLLGRGRYQVTMRGPRSAGVTGTVKVSAAGTPGGDCTVAGWHGTSAGQVIDVDCFSAGGTPQDTNFFVTYVKGNNLMGLNSAIDASALANRPADTHAYRPAVQYSSARGGRVTVRRTSRGNYLVIFAGSDDPGVNGGDVQVATVGRADNHCRTNGWVSGTRPSVTVECISNSGAAVDSQFTIQWVLVPS